MDKFAMMGDWEWIRDARKKAGEETNEDLVGAEWIDVDGMHKVSLLCNFIDFTLNWHTIY